MAFITKCIDQNTLTSFGHMSSKDVHPLIFAFREPFVVLERLSQNADFFSHTHLVFLMLGSWRG